MATEFGVLGAVEARIDGRRVDIGHARQRHVLAALLVDANRTVGIGQLAERVWGSRLPQRAETTLYSYVSRLRRALVAAEDTAIGRRERGYVLSVDERAVDLHRFRALVATARAADTAERSAAGFREALGLWDGDTVPAPDTPWFNALCDSLAAERLAAELDLCDAQLELGRHADLLPGLLARRREHPLDERVARQVMLALYRSGRAGDALAEYRTVRGQLAEALGADPGERLRRLHQRILTADPALEAPAPRAVRTAAPTVPPTPGVPRQLPAMPALFTGRERELAELGPLLSSEPAAESGAEPGTEPGADPGPAAAVISGAGGVGKTWLALCWAHRNQERFADGVLYADLNGFHAAEEPTDPAVVLRGFLGALGAEDGATPADLNGLAALYRGLTAGRRLLVLLDNARDVAQVTPLLPGGSASVALVTSRHQLVGLATTHGARLLGLDALPEAEARALLGRHLGAARLAAEPDSAAALLARCAGLPLAIGILAARALAEPGASLADLAEELRESGGQLDALDSGDISLDLRTVLAASHRALRPDQARAFALLGLAPGPDIGLPAAAALLGVPPSRARALLRSLRTAHLVAEHLPGRYRMHDLTRLYAAERGAGLPAEVGEPALRRLTDHHLFTAYRADALLDPYPTPFEPGEPAPDSLPLRPTDAEAALVWFRAEHEVLRAVLQAAQGRGWHLSAWRLAWSLDTYQLRWGLVHEHIATWRAALASAESLDDPLPRALARQRLGHALGYSGQLTDAFRHLDLGLVELERLGEVRGQAAAHYALANAWHEHGDDERALRHFRRARDLHRTLGDPVREANTCNALGWVEATLGRLDAASAHCEEALRLFGEHDNHFGVAATLDSLGYIEQCADRHDRAADYYRRSLALSLDRLGDRYAAADTLIRLAESHDALGHPAEAREARHRALALYEAQWRTARAADVRALLAAP
ncbi:BTAD domain-containing putative transcriptional regulator [Streptomyces sp. B6B3]|uniref:AfsR/SARP family transcriptional regulator n=1 Tax=Streptomyces sp. B6B3 TaxID=3153570 RepID=UPI00325EB4FA